MLSGPEDMIEEGTPFDFPAEADVNTDMNSDLGLAVAHISDFNDGNSIQKLPLPSLDNNATAIDTLNEGLDDVG